MKLKSLLLLSSRYAWGHRFHGMGGTISLLSVIGLVLGTGLLIAVLAVMNGFDRELRERILSLVPHIRLLPPSQQQLPPEEFEQLASDPQLLSADLYREIHGLLRFRGEVAPLSLWAVDPNGPLLSRQWQPFLMPQHLRAIQQGQGILIGSRLATRLGVDEGDQVTFLAPVAESLAYASFRVAGLIHTGTEMDHGLALVPMNLANDLLPSGLGETGYALYTERVFDAYSHAYQLLGQLPAGYRANTWAATHGNLFEAIQMSRYLVSLIVFLLLAIAAFNVMGSLMISSADRQSDIAILMTIGARRRDLLRLFTLQGGFIGAVGATGGVLLGWIICALLTPALTAIEQFAGVSILNSSIYPLDYLPVDLRWHQVIQVAGLALILSLLGALYPAWRVLSVDPSETLRYE